MAGKAIFRFINFFLIFFFLFFNTPNESKNRKNYFLAWQRRLNR